MKTRFLPSLIVVAILSIAVFGQKTDEYRSLAGGFAINLPAGPQRDSGTGGLVFTWRMPDAVYEVGFLERGSDSAAFSFDEFLREKFGRDAKSPNLTYRKELAPGGFVGVEYRFDTNASILFLRLIDAGNRIYQMKAEIPRSRRGPEASVVSVMDSLRILNAEEVAAERTSRIAAAMPKELPQTPVVPKLTTDASDLGLKGRVKSVVSEVSSLDARGQERSRVTIDRNEFDESGALVRKDDYFFTNEVSSIYLFGYIDGKRVARRGRIESEEMMPAMVIGKPFAGRLETRFDEHYTFKYVGGKLVEKAMFGRDGTLTSRERYNYSKNRRQVEYFDGGRLPNTRVVFELDENGLEQKVTVYSRSGKTYKVTETNKIKYDAIDEQGNWTKRTFYMNYNFDGADNFQPASAYYREIKYH